MSFPPDFQSLATGVAVAGLLFSFRMLGILVTRFVRVKAPSPDERSYMRGVIALIAGAFSFLLAIMVSHVAQTFDSADDALHLEALQLHQLGAVLGEAGPQAAPAEAKLRAYAASILKDEWPAMMAGAGSGRTAGLLRELESEIFRLRSTAKTDARVLDSLPALTFDVIKARMTRLNYADGSISNKYVEACVALCCIIMFATPFAFVHTPMTTWFSIVVAFVVGFLIFLLYEMNGPYNGLIHIDATPLEVVVTEMDPAVGAVPR